MTAPAAMEPVPCSRCGTFIRDRSELLYSDAGDPMCPACRRASDEPRRQVLRARTHPLVWRTLGAAFWSIAGLPVALLILGGAVVTSMPALSTGLVVLGNLRRDEELRAELGARLRLVRISAWVSVVFGSLGGLATLVRLAELLSR